jgi:alginate O-acetyltransferase complex protein AlgJ
MQMVSRNLPADEDAVLPPEELEHRELDSTEISRGTAKALALVFVAMLAAIPFSQTMVEWNKTHHVQALDLFVTPRGGNWRGLLARSRLHDFEDGLVSGSVLKKFFQPITQEWITRWGGFGNDKVVVGRGGWLYYQPGLAYVTGPDFLDRSFQQRVVKKAADAGNTPPTPDPMPALLQLNQDCIRFGIHLVLLPVPDKVMLQPFPLMPFGGRGVLRVPNNPGFERFARDLRARNVDVLNVTPEEIRPGEIRFLSQDTHWTPEFMDSVAAKAADHVRPFVASAGSRRRRSVGQTVRRVGDLVDLLRLSGSQDVYAPETVTIQEIAEAETGKPVEPSNDSPVLLLGDSFTNIFSRADMGWGQHAGFAEHLAFYLGSAVDVVAINGGGTSQVRAELSRLDMAERLGVKKVLLYEFAMRGLAGDDWPVVPMVTPKRQPQQPTAPQAAPSSSRHREVTQGHEAKAVGEKSGPANIPVVILGTVLMTSKVPEPGSAPYKDCLTFVKVKVDTVVSGSYRDTEVIAVFVAMLNNEWLPAARYAIGDRLALRLTPLNKAESNIRSMQRADDLNDLIHQPYYAVAENPR